MQVLYPTKRLFIIAVKNRNRRCIPSDDEESEDEDDDQSILSAEENDFSPTPRVQPALRSNTPVAVSVPAKKPIRKSQPLPSDDENSEGFYLIIIVVIMY